MLEAGCIKFVPNFFGQVKEGSFCAWAEVLLIKKFIKKVNNIFD